MSPRVILRYLPVFLSSPLYTREGKSQSFCKMHLTIDI
nr:MAG TPA: hypothetical protein [Caudoviricetes sp.]